MSLPQENNELRAVLFTHVFFEFFAVTCLYGTVICYNSIFVSTFGMDILICNNRSHMDVIVRVYRLFSLFVCYGSCGVFVRSDEDLLSCSRCLELRRKTFGEVRPSSIYIELIFRFFGLDFFHDIAISLYCACLVTPTVHVDRLRYSLLPLRHL